MRIGPAAVCVFALLLVGCSGASSNSGSGTPAPSAPTAVAGGSYTGTAGTAVSFSAAGSSDPQGQALTYSWNFGDNSAPTTGATPSHTYAAAGTYTVSLTVTDTSGLAGTATAKATIAAAPLPPTANAGGPYTATAGTAVVLNGTGSTDPQGQTLSYAWNFGDSATGTGVSPSHTYAAAGMYTVSLTVTDTSGLTGTATSKATIAAGAPVANAGGPYTGIVGTAINFVGTGSSDPQGEALTYAWTFGDGSTGTGANPTHIYAAPGTFNATLTVANTSNLGNIATSKVTIAAAPPVANVGGPYLGIMGVALNFSAAGSTDPQGEALTYAWDFGDGNTATGVAPTHTYAALGTYTVKVTATNTSSLSNAATVQVVVPNGRVYANGKVLAGERVHMLAANTTGYGGLGLPPSSANASVSLLSTATASDTVGGYVLTGADGSFFINGDYSCTPGSQVYLYALGGDPPLGLGRNTGIGLLAALGACPSAGNFAATPYVVVNEVSTIATAYAFAGFARDATHVSSSGTALAKVGIANAFANVTNLETLGTGVALATTPAGNGTVPQAEINTLANILASCTSTSSSASNGCAMLFANTLNAGLTGVAPIDTANAAINIAHNPGANFLSLNSLAQNSPIFLPNTPSMFQGFINTFMVMIVTTGGGVGTGPGIAIDGSGDVWLANGGFVGPNGYTGSNVVELSPLGAFLSGTSGYTGGGLQGPNGIAIDSAGNAWIANQGGSTITEISSTGAYLSGAIGYSGSGLQMPSGIAIDGNNNVWVGNYGANSVAELTSAGTAVSGSPFTGGGLDIPSRVAIDGFGNVWAANLVNNSVTELSASGAILSGSTGYTGGFLSQPDGIAIDSSGNAFVTSLQSGYVTKVAGSVATGFAGSFVSPYSVAIDGSDTAWIGSSSQLGIISSAGSLVKLNGEDGKGSAVVPNAIAIDGSGDAWLYGLHEVYELIGSATPVVTPLSAGVKNNMLGTRP